NLFYYEAYTIENTFKPLLTIILGWVAYLIIFRRSALKLPQIFERFEHLIGVMSLMLTMLFWMVFV
ncbi:MAG: cation:proton antiporter, partial [Cyanobacteria bacterium P01_H01_bin.121]